MIQANKCTLYLIKRTTIFLVFQGVGTISSEFQKSTIIYEAPVELRKRSDYLVNNPEDEKIIAPDEESTGMVMHKDSRWSQSWQNFKDSNQYVHKLFDLKTKYDESDHLAVRMTRAFTDRIGSVFGGMLQPTKMSEVLTEIEKMDPTFEKEKFLQQCRQDLVPNVLESWVRGDLEILQDWCYEAAFNVLGQPVQQNLAMGLKSQCKVLDISPVELAAGQLMEQGPVLIISFSTQQVEAWVDKSNKVVSGDPDKLLKVVHVWALCRDQSILDPRAAWRVLEFSFHPTEQLF
ncbi:mitochondrial import inner membrane translocase subunit TIM44-like [Lingula anatina]|uniref:Mitochondrial import inner membrane translocase subunit TIM44-like n=1 Tax=Lingula anatina TaxID=7574 RepID=A0A1S3HWB7_LINAN|nr:mitochondrial import inner membrane translocase subunit TIM44-like [Lingula anatina]|eukprot:XP_013389354.1 mitochondrial import inner membrane translocase subunit TIM44-like [Lingula anatina]